MQKRSAVQAFLLDVDGTLVDSNDLHADAWLEAFSHFGKELPRDTVRFSIGKGGDILVPDLLNAREMQKFGDEIRKYRTRLYKKKYMPLVKAFPRVRENLEALHDRGAKLVLATSAEPDEVESLVEMMKIGDLLEGQTSAGDARVSKPSPEIFQRALEQAGTPVEKSVVVGDTPYDILSAHRASLAVAAVRSGGFPEEQLRKAEFLFSDLDELVRRIDEVDDYIHG